MTLTYFFHYDISVVNEAYSCENGCSGFGHKKDNRMISPTEGNMLSAYREGRVMKVVQTETGRIVGMMYWEVTQEKSLYFGPYAVSPAFQGRGIGKLMFAEVERIARERKLTEIRIVVVNIRTDLISMYKHMGFVQTGTAPFPPHAVYKLTRTDVHIIEMSRPLQQPTVDAKAGNDEYTCITGGCFCGKVRYQITSPPSQVYFCHCSNCRRVSGSVVMAWLSIPSTTIQFATTSSDDTDARTEYVVDYPSDLTSYNTSACFERWFCRTCASHIMFSRRGSHDMVEICHGSLDAPALLPPRNHIWTESQLPFLHLNDSIPKFATEPCRVRVFFAKDFGAVRELWKRGLMNNTTDPSLCYPSSLVEEESQFVANTLDNGDMANVDALSGVYLSDPCGRTCFWVYESDGVVIGCIGLRLGSFPSGDISRFGVDEEHRGLGVGSKLLATVDNFARNVGYTSLTATTVSLNVPAVNCYIRAGYKEVFRGRQDGNTNEPDFVKLKKDLA